MKLLRTSFLSAIITFIRLSAGFVAGKFVALYAGAAGVAMIGQFSNFITIATTFANGAINNGVIKYTAEFDDDENYLKRLFSTSLKISLSCSVIFGSMLFIASSYISQFLFENSTYSIVIKVFSITIIFYSINTLLISILNGKKQINQYTIANLSGSLFSLAFTIVLVIYYKAIGAIYALVLSQSVVVFITIALVIKSKWFNLSFLTEKYDKEIGAKLLNYSLMALVTALTSPLSQILLRKTVADQFGINAAGYWQGVMRISDGYLLLVTTTLSTYYLPKLSSIKTNSLLRTEIFKGYRFFLPLVFIGCVLVFYCRFLIIHMLFTKDFISMEKLFLFQLLGDFFKIAAWILAYLMIAKAMIKRYIITEVCFTITYIALGVFCTKYMGLIGITIAFAINYVVYFIVFVCIFRKLLLKKYESITDR